MERDWITILGILLMFMSLVIAVQYYFNQINNECLSNPILYGAKQYEKTYSSNVYGSLTLVPIDINIKPVTFIFSSKNITVRD